LVLLGLCVDLEKSIRECAVLFGKSRMPMTDSSRHAPELANIKGWLNSPPLRLSELRGKVVFLDFWTYSCINCVRTIPEMNRLHLKYPSDELVIIGVHTPEFEYEKDAGNVKSAVDRLGISYPVALDSDNATWKLYGNRYWPRQTLIDHSGEVRYEHIGEGGFEEIEEQAAGLLAEAAGQRKLSQNP
jgi:thiol-disulfide isomerase/thioredoxin